MSNSVNSSLRLFHNTCLRKGVPFVSYQLPGTNEKLTMLASSKLLTLKADEKLPQHSNGFLFAPFESNQPKVWMYASQIFKGTAIPSKIVSEIESLQNAVTPDPLPPSTTKEQYFSNVLSVIDQLQRGPVKKVVLSRIINIPFSMVDLAPVLFENLTTKYPDAFTYLLCFPGYGIWIGASPELLLSVDKITDTESRIETMALAGTRRAGVKQEWGFKEKDEHEWVRSYIRLTLEETRCNEITESKTYTTNAGNIEHLCTDFKAILQNEDISLLINRLHPTPAVCGWPKEEAREIILKTENYNRRFYTGYIGPVIGHQAKFFVNLRCMQSSSNEAIIYSGGGITSQSNVNHEWEETIIKSQTLLAEIEKIRNLAT